MNSDIDDAEFIEFETDNQNLQDFLLSVQVFDDNVWKKLRSLITQFSFDELDLAQKISLANNAIDRGSEDSLWVFAELSKGFSQIPLPALEKLVTMINPDQSMSILMSVCFIFNRFCPINQVPLLSSNIVETIKKVNIGSPALPDLLCLLSKTLPKLELTPENCIEFINISEKMLHEKDTTLIIYGFQLLNSISISCTALIFQPDQISFYQHFLSSSYYSVVKYTFRFFTSYSMLHGEQLFDSGIIWQMSTIPLRNHHHVEKLLFKFLATGSQSSHGICNWALSLPETQTLNTYQFKTRLYIFKILFIASKNHVIKVTSNNVWADFCISLLDSDINEIKHDVLELFNNEDYLPIKELGLLELLASDFDSQVAELAQLILSKMPKE